MKKRASKGKTEQEEETDTISRRSRKMGQRMSRRRLTPSPRHTCLPVLVVTLKVTHTPVHTPLLQLLPAPSRQHKDSPTPLHTN